jgi:hypothetical protein
MATFSQMMKGGPARHPILPFELIDGTKITGDDCAVIPLLGEAEAKVLKGAREFAIEHGLAEPKPGDPLYELGRAIWTCALGVVDGDPKVPETAPVLFFDGGVKQIREKLDRDRIFFLARQQEAWQSEMAPGVKNLSPEDMQGMIHRIKEAPEGAELPLESWPGATQRIFIRGVVNTLLTLQELLLRVLPTIPAGGTTSSSYTTLSESSEVSSSRSRPPQESHNTTHEPGSAQ